jgi:hypothetical protein
MNQQFVFYASLSCSLIYFGAIVLSLYGHHTRKRFEHNHPDVEHFPFKRWHVWLLIFSLPLLGAMFVFSTSKGAFKGYDELLVMNSVFLAICLLLPISSNVCLYVGDDQIFVINAFGLRKKIDFKGFELSDEKENWIFGGYTLLIGKLNSIRIWRDYENSNLAIDKIKRGLSRHA